MSTPVTPDISTNYRRHAQVVGVSVALIVLLNLLTVFVAFPASTLPIVKEVVVACLLALPILAIFHLGPFSWSAKSAFGLLVLGIGTQALCVWSANYALKAGPLAAVVGSLSSVGLLLWCAALGALLAVLIKDKNLILPISVFLACLDVFLVLSPVGPTQYQLKVAPQVLQHIGYVIPKVSSEQPKIGPVGAYAYVGPADFIFMAMFFIVLFKYRMRVKETIIALIPTLVFYLLIVRLTGIPLPALVPIGLCVLLVNLREFKLAKDEWAATALVAALGIGINVWGFTRQPKRPAVPSPSPVYQEAQESANLPATKP